MVDMDGRGGPTPESECAFCGGREGLVKQHAVPYWLMHEAHADPEVIHSYILNDISSLISGNFSFPDVVEREHPNLTDFFACESCVNGWIEELEVRAVEPFSRLLNLPASQLEDAYSMVDFLESNAGVLARGAFKTVLSCDFAVDELLVIPPEHYRMCAEKSIPHNVSVDLGFCREPSGFRILSGPLGNTGENLTRCIYRVAFQSGHMVMMVRSVDGPLYDLYPGTITLYPDFRVGADLDVFSDSLEIIAWDLLAMVYYNEKSSDFFGLLD